MHFGLQVKYHYSCQILMKLEFYDRFFKNMQIPNLLKICTVKAELFHMDGWMDRQTDMIKLTFTSYNFANVP